MRKSIAATAAAITLAAAAWLLQPIPSHEAAAQPAPLHIHAVDSTSCRARSTITSRRSRKTARPPSRSRAAASSISRFRRNHVFIFEVYDDAAAAQAHRETEHFKKYAAATKDMVAKREVRPLASVAMNIKRM